MNGSLIFVIWIVTVVMIANVLRTWIKQKNVKPEENEEIQETIAKIDRLEERIKVLERIITENRFDLKSEIDRL
ncbi:MAG: hypothetical protein ACR2Q3_02270 [Woeseiaceae bacterium]